MFLTVDEALNNVREVIGASLDLQIYCSAHFFSLRKKFHFIFSMSSSMFYCLFSSTNFDYMMKKSYSRSRDIDFILLLRTNISVPFLYEISANAINDIYQMSH